MQVGQTFGVRYSTGYECLQEVSAEIRVVPRDDIIASSLQ